MPALAIDYYFYTDIRISANPNLEIDTDISKIGNINLDQINYSATPEFEEVNKSSLSLTLTMSISTNAEIECTQSPYFFNFEMVGVFDITDIEGMQTEVIPHLLNDAASSLYGSMRDKLVSLTHQMPYGPIHLPILDIVFESNPDIEE